MRKVKLYRLGEEEQVDEEDDEKRLRNNQVPWKVSSIQIPENINCATLASLQGLYRKYLFTCSRVPVA